VSVRFTKPLESFGYLYYSFRGERGRSLLPPSPRPWTPSGWVRLCERLGGVSAEEREEAVALAGDRYEQEQLFVETSTPLSPDGLGDVEAFFLRSRDRLRKR